MKQQEINVYYNLIFLKPRSATLVQIVEAPLENVTLVCPRYYAVMKQFQCQLYVTSGSSLEAYVDYGGVYQETFNIASK